MGISIEWELDSYIEGLNFSHLVDRQREQFSHYLQSDRAQQKVYNTEYLRRVSRMQLASRRKRPIALSEPIISAIVLITKGVVLFRALELISWTAL